MAQITNAKMVSEQKKYAKLQARIFKQVDALNNPISKSKVRKNLKKLMKLCMWLLVGCIVLLGLITFVESLLQVYFPDAWAEACRIGKEASGKVPEFIETLKQNFLERLGNFF